MIKTEIKFTTVGHKNRLTGDMTCYQGQLEHNQVLGPEECRRLFAEYMRVNEPNANLYIDGLCGFMEKYLAEGYRLDFGGFSAGLRLRGGFPSANAPFDASRNGIGVDLTPGKRIKGVVRSLKPINVTPIGPCRIFGSLQLQPYEAYDTIVPVGERTLLVSGDEMRVNPSGVGEGVWVESDEGEVLLRGTILEAALGRCRVRFTDPVAPGLHWLVVSSRHDPAGDLMRARRRITVPR